MTTSRNVAHLVFAPVDNARLVNLCGALDGNLRHMEEVCGVRIVRRGAEFTLSGKHAKALAQALDALYLRAEQPLAPEDMHYELSQVAPVSSSAAAAPASKNPPPPVLALRNVQVRGRTRHQVEYLDNIRRHGITFGTGPAGTGKTYLAVACAVHALEREEVERIVLTRPAVEAGERLGFLPGDMAQKVNPYLRPLYDALYELMGFERVSKLQERNALEIAPLAFMRGRTLNNAFVILDEAQNTTREQMKMFLTRIGAHSRAVVTGDPTQIDLPNGVQSGLLEARAILANVAGIGFTVFEKSDVVRHPLVSRIVAAYEAAEAAEADAAPARPARRRR